jgi:hypothetical protein
MRKEMWYLIVVLVVSILIAGCVGPQGPPGTPGSIVKTVTGKAFHNDTISVPSGYTVGQCTMVVYADEITEYNVNAQTPPYKQITYITDSTPQESGFKIINHVRLVWSATGEQTYAPNQFAADYLMLCIK